ncbi:transglycosylase SLT domain-containing protein [Nanoarchaeota archaeon]
MFSQYERYEVSLRDLATLVKLSGQKIDKGFDEIEPFLEEFNNKNFVRIEEFKKLVLDLFDKLEELKRFAGRLEHRELVDFKSAVELCVKNQVFEMLGPERGKEVWEALWEHIKSSNKHLREGVIDERRTRAKRIPRGALFRKAIGRNFAKDEEEAGRDLQDIRRKKDQAYRDLTAAIEGLGTGQTDAQLKELAGLILKYSQIMDSELKVVRVVGKDVDAQEITLIRELKVLKDSEIPQVKEAYDEIHQTYRRQLLKDRNDKETIKARDSMNRRQFLRITGTAAAGLAVAPKLVLGQEQERIQEIRNATDALFDKAYGHLKTAVTNLLNRRQIPEEYWGLMNVFLAVMYKESEFVENARSRATDDAPYGYFQLKPEAIEDMGYSVNDRTDPLLNCEIGLLYLRTNQERAESEFNLNVTESLKFAVIAHNMGFMRVENLRKLLNAYTVPDFINALRTQAATNEDYTYRYNGWTNGKKDENKTDLVTVAKMNEAINYFTKITDWAQYARGKIDEHEKK